MRTEESQDRRQDARITEVVEGEVSEVASAKVPQKREKSTLNRKKQRRKLSAWKKLESISIHLLQNETIAALTTFLFLLGAIAIPFYCWIDLFEAF